MHTPFNQTRLPDRHDAALDRHQPLSTMQAIIQWIIDTDRRFRRSQDRIDRLSDRF